MSTRYRLLKETAYPFLKEMLYEAIFVPDGEPKLPRAAREEPDVRKYMAGWGRYEDDVAIPARQ